MKKAQLIKALPYVVAVLTFVILASVYFNPQLKGYTLNASDTKTFLGMSKEIMDHRDTEGEETLWTNSMFGGMPSYQISVNHKMNLIHEFESLAVKRVLGHPISILFLCMLGFFIMLLCFNINPWVAMVGAIAFGFSTINILYLSAGHNSRVDSIAFMAPVIGGIYYAYRKNMYIGASLTALFVCLQIATNHLQETYYLLFFIVAIVLVELYRHFKEKMLKKFFQVSLFLVVAAIIGVLPTMSNLITTSEYAKYSTRSETDLSITLGESKEEITSGLDRWYIKQYNLGKSEVLAMVIPNIKGGASGYLGMHKDEVKNNTDRQFREYVAQQSGYWGEQRYTGGAFYFGASMFLLFILGLIFLKDPLKYVLIVVALLAIVLSWKESAILDFFIDYVPMFNKFRDSKIMLVLVQMIFPLVGALYIKELLNRKLNVKKTLYTIGAVVLIFGAIYVTPTTWFDFFSKAEMQQLNQQASTIQGAQNVAQFESFKNNIEQVRVAIFKGDVVRSMLFIIVIGALVILFLRTKMNKGILIAAIAAIVLIDLWVVNKRYVDNDKHKGKYIRWVEKYQRQNPYRATTADKLILQEELKEHPEITEKIQIASQKHFKDDKVDKKYKGNEQEKIAFRELNRATNYRVLTLEDPFNSSTISYYHKSIGGYHGAKLRRYQELIEARIHKEMQVIADVTLKNEPTDSSLDVMLTSKLPTLNMLNTKYIVTSSREKPIKNIYHNGSAWFVNKAKIVENTDKEILALNEINPKVTAVVNEKFVGEGLEFNYDSTAEIKMSSYLPNHLVYDYNAKSAQLAVFSEIYYPKGWNAYIDGKKTDYFRANYVLRAMVLPEGAHKVEFKFEPSSFKKGSTISLIGSILLILMLAGSLFMEYKKRKKKISEKENKKQ